MRGEVLKGHLDMLLLAVLRSEETHGYAILSALRERSRGAFDLPEGTIYPALHRLAQAGLIDSRPEEANGRKRRVYALTERGRTALRISRSEWRLAATAMTALGCM